MPVSIMAMPLMSQSFMHSLSSEEPPGWIIAVTCVFDASCMHFKGRGLSEASTTLSRGWIMGCFSFDLLMAIFRLSRREGWPEPIPMVCYA